MPIGSDRSSGINIAPIAAVGANNPPPPAVGDLMAAFRSGFITVDDLTRRGASLPVAVAGAQQDLKDTVQLRPLAREATVGQLTTDIQLQPKRAENMASAEDLKGRMIAEQGRQLPTAAEAQADDAGRARKAQFLNAVNSTVPGVREKALATATVEDILSGWATATGQEPPESIQVPGGGVEPKPIEDWIVETYGPNSLAVDAQAVINRPDVQQGYKEYSEEARNRPLTYFKGSPEYTQKLREDLAAANLKAGLQKATIEAAPKILQSEAEIRAKAPAEAMKAGREAVDAVLSERNKSKALDNYTRQAETFLKVDQIRNSGRTPTNADDISLMYEYVKLLDPTSAVREGEAKLTASTVPAVRAWIPRAQALFVDRNKIFDEGSRQSLYLAMDDLKAGAQQAIRPELERLSTLASNRGVSIDQVFTGPERELLGGAKTPAARGAAPAAPTPGAPGAPEQSKFKVGARVTLGDGRVVTVKRVTPTGFVFEE